MLLNREIRIMIKIVLFQLLTRNTEIILGHPRKMRVDFLIFKPPTEQIGRCFGRGCEISCEFLIKSQYLRHWQAGEVVEYVIQNVLDRRLWRIWLEEKELDKQNLPSHHCRPPCWFLHMLVRIPSSQSPSLLQSTPWTNRHFEGMWVCDLDAKLCWRTTWNG